MRRTVAVAAALAGLLTAAVPATAGPSSTPTLGGRVTLSGSTTGYLSVIVPKAAVLSRTGPDRRDAVRITGGGKMSGFALVATGSRDFALIGGRSDFTRDYTDENGVFVMRLGNDAVLDKNGFIVVPAGAYRLYLITDGKPTSVALGFDGLSGHRKLTPKTKKTLLTQGGQPRLTPEDTGVLFSEGYGAALDGPTLHFAITAVETDVHTETSKSWCFYFRKPAGPNPYLPGCPSTNGGAFWLHRLHSDERTDGFTFISYSGVRLTAPGDYGSGVGVVTGSTVTDADYAHFWLTL